MKNAKWIVVGAVLMVLIGFYVSNSIQSTDLVKIEIASTVIEAEVADDETEKAQGLSNRDSLSQNKGMLFIFDAPSFPNFHMKDMKFDLDLIWIAENGKVIAIDKNVSPQSYPKQTFYPPEAVKFVLEVNGGFSEDKGITPGDIVKINL